MIVLVLVVIWIVALAPLVVRKLSEHQVSTSVANFRHLTWKLGRTAPMGIDEQVESREHYVTDSEEERRVQRARARIRSQRRRRTLTWLLGFGAFTLVFGAIHALRMLWNLTILDVVLTASYLGALAYFTHIEMLQRERRAMRNVYSIASGPTNQAQRPAYAAAGGSARILPVPIPIRPTFRIVEAPS